MKVLLITPFFLQQNNPSAIQSRLIYNQIYDHNIELTVLTSKEKDSITEKFHRIIEIKDFQNRLIQGVFRRTFKDLHNILQYSFWGILALIKLKSLLKDEKFDFIITISHPIICHLIPLFIARSEPLKWIAHFYDPWIENPYRKFRYHRIAKLDKYFERIIARKADQILHTNKLIKNCWVNKYPWAREKIYILNFTYFKKNENFKNLKHRDSIIISHIGNIYGGRSLELILSSIEILRASGFIENKRIVLKLVGFVSSNERARIKKSTLKDVVKIIPPMPHLETVNVVRESTHLLIIEDLEQESLFFPSKLLEYLSYFKAVIGISPIHSLTSKILRSIGHPTFQKGGHLELSNFLKNEINSISYTYDFEKQRRILEKYSQSETQKKLIKCLNIVSEKTHDTHI